jgi:methyl-accepting chemotaxis protein
VLQIAASDPVWQTTSLSDQKDKLLELESNLQWVTTAHTVGQDGMDIVRADNNVLVSVADRDYFKGALNSMDLSTEVIVSRVTKKPTLAMALPIQNKRGGRGGVIAISATLDVIATAVTTKTSGRTGFAFLVDAKGRVIAHPHVPMQATLVDYTANPAVQAALNGKSGYMTYPVDGHEVAAFVQRTHTGWISVVQQDVAEIKAPLRKGDTYAAELLGITIAIVVILSLFITRNLVSPIVFLTKVADQISRGEHDHHIVQSKRSDEIGALARSIERLAKSMKLAMQRLQKR